MPVKQLVGAPITVTYKPTLAHQLLRGCAGCRHPHPLAMKPMPLDVDHCPNCGLEVAPPEEPVDVPNVTARWIWLANLMNRLADIVLSLAKRI